MKKLTNFAFLVALVLLVFAPIFGMIESASDYLVDDEGNQTSVIEVVKSFNN